MNGGVESKMYVHSSQQQTGSATEPMAPRDTGRRLHDNTSSDKEGNIGSRHDHDNDEEDEQGEVSLGAEEASWLAKVTRPPISTAPFQAGTDKLRLRWWLCGEAFLCGSPSDSDGVVFAGGRLFGQLDQRQTLSTGCSVWQGLCAVPEQSISRLESRSGCSFARLFSSLPNSFWIRQTIFVENISFSSKPKKKKKKAGERVPVVTF